VSCPCRAPDAAAGLRPARLPPGGRQTCGSRRPLRVEGTRHRSGARQCRPANERPAMSTAAPGPAAQNMPHEDRKVLAGTLVGTTIEWYDFFIYAQAAGLVLSAQYFGPLAADSPALGQIMAWASLGISFLFRPLGAIIAGHLG